MHDDLLTAREAARYLGYRSHRTLANHRCRGEGPSFVRLNGRSIRYRRSALEAWIIRRDVPSAA